MIFANFQCPGAFGFSLLLAGLHVRCVHVIVFLERIGHIVATCFANVFIKCESRKPSRRSEFQIFSNFRVWGTRPASISWLWIIHRTIGSFPVIQPKTSPFRKSGRRALKVQQYQTKSGNVCVSGGLHKKISYSVAGLQMRCTSQCFSGKFVVIVRSNVSQILINFLELGGPICPVC